MNKFILDKYAGGEKMEKDYKKVASDILENVGGKDNVVSAMHCYTRLRLNLKDKSLVNMDSIKEIGVIGAQYSGDQLQIIIGNEVNEIYDEFVQISGVEKESAIDENLDDNLSKKKKWTLKEIVLSVLDAIVGCVVPMLPILIGSGLIQAFVLILNQTGIMAADADTSVTLNFVANSAFYFMPVIVGVFAAKKFGGNLALGAMIGAMLIHPDFISAVSSGDPGSIFGIPIHSASYSSTLVPAILSVFVMSYLEKFISKHCPKMIRSVAEPFLTILIMTPLTLCLLAPLGSIISDGVMSIINWEYHTLGFLSIAIHCALLPLETLSGLHTSFIAYAIQEIGTTGIDPIVLPCALLANFAQGAACLAVGLKNKNKDVRSYALSSAFSNFVPGVSEPGMYGITMRYKTPMIGAMIGGFAGGAILGIFNVAIFSFVAPNLFSLPAYVGTGTYANNLLYAVIAYVVAIVVTFVVTLIIYKPEEKGE